MSKIKGFIGETLVYGFGNVFSRLFAMFLIPLYAKFLGKIDYSNLVMLQSSFTILTFMLTLNAGIFYYYYEYDNLRYRKIVFTSWFYYQIGIATIICVFLFFASPYLFNLFILTANNQDILRWSLILIGLQLFPYTFNNTNINYCRIERKPKKVVLIVSLEAIFTVIFVTLSLVVFKKGLIAVLLSQILARSIVALIFIRYAQIYIKIKNFSKRLLKKILVYTWPFLISSVFTWVIISIDKFIGAQALTDKTEVALLSLAMQLVLPIAVLSDMIKMALAPYTMSIRKDSDAEDSYQKIYDLVTFAASLGVVGVVLLSPFLTFLLADKTYLQVIYVIPLMAFAKVLSLVANQFSISFSLVKKTTYILYSVILASVVGVLVNVLFMKKYGFVVSGYSQIASYIAMSVFLFSFGRKVANLKLKLKNSFILMLIVMFYIISLFFINPLIEKGEYMIFIAVSIVFLSLLVTVYFKQQKLNPIIILRSFLKVPLKKNKS
ncbi:MAG: oligosaccharide flippase family protein [Bacteroidales bacterium]|nr:oligosaccharide flippase family protein [Bacteroidales bacterium]